MTADEFNAAYPVGTRVLAFPGTQEGLALHTRTRTRAWNIIDRPVVSVEGYAGCVALTHIEIIEGAPSTDDAMREDHVQDRARPDAARRQWDAWLAEHDARIRTAAAREALDGLAEFIRTDMDEPHGDRAASRVWGFRDTHYPEDVTP